MLAAAAGYTPSMNRRTLPVLGITLTVLGAAGLAVTLAFTLSPVGSGAFSSNGQRIFYTGLRANGSPIPRTVAGRATMGREMMTAVGCVDCHGEDGRGGVLDMMFGFVEVSDIRYSALTSIRSEDGTMMPAWTDSDIARALRDGIEPGGQRLKAPMPRWDMTDAEMSDVIAYLKELDAR